MWLGMIMLHVCRFSSLSRLRPQSALSAVLLTEGSGLCCSEIWLSGLSAIMFPRVAKHFVLGPVPKVW